MSWFDTFTLCQMNPVETASGLVTPPGIGTVKIDVLKTDRSIMQLTLKDITYIPGCLYNLVRVGKLMKEGGYTKPGKLIYLRKGKETELCTIDDNLHLIIANKSP